MNAYLGALLTERLHKALDTAGRCSGLCYQDGELHRILTPTAFYEAGPMRAWFERFAEALMGEYPSGKGA